MFNNPSHLKRLFAIFEGYKGLSFLLFAAIISSSLLESFSLTLLMPLLDAILGRGDSLVFQEFKVFEYLFSGYSEGDRIMFICAFLIGILIAKNILMYARDILGVYLSWKMRVDWMRNIFDKYVHAKYLYILNKKEGDLVNDLITEPARAAKSLKGIIRFGAEVFLALSLYAALLFISLKGTFAATVVVILTFLIIKEVSKNYSMLIGDARITLSRQLTSSATEAIGGIMQVKLFGLEKLCLGRFINRVKSLAKTMLKFELIRNAPRPLVETVMVLFVAGLIIYFAKKDYKTVSSSFPIWSTYLIIFNRLVPHVASLIMNRMEIYSLIPSLSLVDNLAKIDVPTEQQSFSRYRDFTFDRAVKIENLTFGYNQNVHALKNINLTIEKGKTTAIVGKTGSGKSTIAALIARLYENYQGTIKVDDVDLREISREEWRKRIGFVSQQPFLFNDTILNNLRIVTNDAGEKEIFGAAKLANAHDFIIKLEKGYDTIVGDRGVNLSVGQLQRITIARAILRDPDMLIFDEATSALDYESAKLIQQSIRKLKGDKTILIIAHRLSTIRDADMIYVLHEGRVVESGNYRELCENKGYFWKIVNSSEVSEIAP